MILKDLLQKIKKGKLEIYLFTNYQGYIEVIDTNEYKKHFELESFEYLSDLEIKCIQVKLETSLFDEYEEINTPILDVTLVE